MQEPPEEKGETPRRSPGWKGPYLDYLVVWVDELHLWDTEAHWVASRFCL